MSQGNKIWTIALILVVLTLISSSFVEAQIFDHIRDGISNLWDIVEDYVTSLTFWINVGIAFIGLFIFVQWREDIRNRFQGNRQIILYLLLIALSIFIAVQLGDRAIYNYRYVRWILYPSSIINVILIYAIITLLMVLFPDLLGNVIGRLREHALMNLLVVLVISLIIAFNVANVDASGVPQNRAMLWNSRFWISIEERAFGNRIGGFGQWSGTYTSGGQQRYGFLHWQPQPLLIGGGVTLRGQFVQPPALPPIVIFLITYVLLRASLGRMFRESGLNESILRLMYLYLAMVVTTRGMTVSDLILYGRIFLLIIFLNALHGIQEITFITRFTIAWVLSATLLGLILQPGVPPNLGWVWIVLGWEGLRFIWPFIEGMYQGIRGMAAGLPGPWGLIAGIGGTAALIGLLTTFGPQLIGGISNQLGQAIRRVIENLGIALPFKSGSPDMGGIRAGSPVTGFILLAIIMFILKSLGLLPDFVFDAKAAQYAFIGGLAAAIIGRKVWTSRVGDQFRREYAQSYGKDSEENRKSWKKLVKEDPEMAELVKAMVNRAKQGNASGTERAIQGSHSTDHLRANLGLSRRQMPVQERQGLNFEQTKRR